MKNTKKPAFKAIVLNGRDEEGNFDPTLIIAPLKSFGLKEDVDFIIIGDGTHLLDQSKTKAIIQGRINHTTRFFFNGHGLVKNIKDKYTHTIKLFETDYDLLISAHQQETTEYALNFIQNVAGDQAIYVSIAACFAGKTKACIEVLHEGSFLESWATDEHISFISENRKSIIDGIKRHVGAVSAPGFDPVFTFLDGFRHTLCQTVETVNISHKKIASKEVVHHTCRTPGEKITAYKTFERLKEADLENYKRSFIISKILGIKDPKLVQYMIEHTPYRETYIPLKSYFSETRFIDEARNVLFGATHNIPSFTLTYSQTPVGVRPLRYVTFNFLYEVAAKGSLEVLKQHFQHCKKDPQLNALIRSSGNSEKIDIGKTPLLIAIQNNHPEVAILLMENDANPHLCDKNGRNALHYAVESGNTMLVKTLIAMGVDVNAADKDGSNPLDMLLFGQQKLQKTAIQDIVRQLYDHGATTGKCSPLRAAVYFNLTGLANYLVAQGEDVNDDKSAQKSLLELAAGHDNLLLFQTLCEHGATLTPTNKDTLFCSMMHKFSNMDIARYLLDSEDLIPHLNTTTAFNNALQFSNLKGVELLLEYRLVDLKNPKLVNQIWNDAACAKAIINDKDFDSKLIDKASGDNYLHTIAQTYRFASEKEELVSCMKQLIVLGTDVNARNANGQTPLHIAATLNRTAFIQCLLENGADQTLKDSNGKTPSDLAKKTPEVQSLFTPKSTTPSKPVQKKVRKEKNEDDENPELSIVERNHTDRVKKTPLSTHNKNQNPKQSFANRENERKSKNKEKDGKDKTTTPDF